MLEESNFYIQKPIAIHISHDSQETNHHSSPKQGPRWWDLLGRVQSEKFLTET